MRKIKIGERLIGDGEPCFVVAEIGINHNGDLGNAFRLIDAAKDAGCDAVKFQFRDVDALFTPQKMSEPKESPFGTTYGEYVRGREFSEDERAELVYHAMSQGLLWGASYWGCGPDQTYPQPDFIKVPSARVKLHNEIKFLSSYGIPMVASIGGCTPEEASKVISDLRLNQTDHVVLQCNSTYPASVDELGLGVIKTLRECFPYMVVGYSGHELGIAMSLAARVLGASIIERHITLDRSMWGTDQAASLEPSGIKRLVRDIRNFESALGDGIKRVYPGEVSKMQTLGVK